jgi:predicted RNase H-like HicB family nuclease
MNIRVVIEQDEDDFYVAEVPAMPGCLSQGRTREEAIANIREAIVGWLEVIEQKAGAVRGEPIEVSL